MKKIFVLYVYVKDKKNLLKANVSIKYVKIVFNVF